MKLSQLNEYFQTLATLGAIAGLLLVAYQVKQTNAIVMLETAKAGWSLTTANRNAWLESGVARVIAKSVTEPERLSLEEKIELDLYLQAYAMDWTQAIWSAEDLYPIASDSYVDRGVAFLLEIASAEAPQMFGSKFARGWLEKNQGKGFLQPNLYEAFQRGLKEAPIDAVADYYNDIDRLADSLD